MELSGDFWKMAERFVAFIYRETGFKTIVCDKDGIIRKAHDTRRIGNPHAGAQKILTSSINEIAITKDDEARNPLTKEGLNRAIVIDGEKVASFGIGGDLRIVQPVARIAAMIMSLWIDQLRQQDLVHETAQSVSREISSLTRNIDTATGHSESLGQTMTEATKQAFESVTTTDKIIDAVQDIAQQAFLLSINAGIEASRFGAQGRAFGIVADEMRRLSEGTKKAMENTQNTIDEIRKAINNVDSATKESSVLFAENMETMRSVAPMVNLLLGSIQKLEVSFNRGVG